MSVRVPCSLPQQCPSRAIIFLCDTVPLVWEGPLGGEAGGPRVRLKTFIFQLSEGSCPSCDCWASPQTNPAHRSTLDKTEPRASSPTYSREALSRS